MYVAAEYLVSFMTSLLLLSRDLYKRHAKRHLFVKYMTRLR